MNIVDYLQQFCDPDNGRYDVSKPFQHNSYSIGTNGFVVVAIQNANRIDNGTRSLPPVDMFPWSLFKSNGFQAWPETKLVEYEYYSDCTECDSKGRVGNDVKECEVRIFDLEFCDKCKVGWVGGSECDSCGGEGHNNKVACIGNKFISPKFEKIITKMPGQVSFLETDYGKAIPFRSEQNGDWPGCIGFICPITNEGGSAL